MIFPRSDHRRSTAVVARHRRSSRRALVLVLLASVFLASACLPADLTAKLITPATNDRVQGDGPLTSMWNAGKAKAACGLTPAQLTAMLIVPTSFESGTKSPSPMTLSRWDNVKVWSLNANLFPFGATTGAYTSAFYSPGIGLWQFDSAGGWNLTAASAINTDSAAMQAATTIAYRWCNAPSDRLNDPVRRRAYAWAAWYYCGTDSRCETAYNAILKDDKLNIGTDGAIDNLGGMEQRTCNVVGLGENLTCFYIDPARAQGSKSWTYGTYDPARPDYLTPLPKPFYDIELNGNEYRIWVRDDTGFDIGITATKPVTANARTSVVWSRVSNLCDLTAKRGDCEKPRVAQTPVGPRSENPFGYIETATVSKLNRVTVNGWTIDPDVVDPIPVHIYVDGVGAGSGLANLPRSDVDLAVPGYGANHGYSLTVDLTGGTHEVCTYAINVGAYGNTNPLLGCLPVTIPVDPIGGVDSVQPVTGGLLIRGWAVDADTTAPLDVHIYADGVFAKLATANLTRPDIANRYPSMGPAHGFEQFVPLSAGTHSLCAFAINVGPGATNPNLGCVSKPVSGEPLGSLELVAPSLGSATVAGWGFDPETKDAKIAISVDGGAPVIVPTTLERPDVALVYPQFGSLHGFQVSVPVPGGTHQVCVVVRNEGVGGTNRNLGCRSVTIPTGPPVGNLEATVRAFGGLIVQGWAVDPDTANPVTVQAFVNGVYSKSFVADVARPDVGAVYRGYGDAHGFLAYIKIPSTPTSVCLFLINQGTWTQNPVLSCRTY